MIFFTPALLLLAANVHGTPTTPSPQGNPSVVDATGNVIYEGVYESGVEAFLGIRYGQDTGGQNRFKRPQAFTYDAGTTVAARSSGPACPQRLGDVLVPVYLGNITEISEDCLLLNVKRPNGTESTAKLPVMVWIHGGSLYASSKDEITTQPSGLILESIENCRPVLHVGLNYRLGVFGFAQSDALQQEGSTNVGLRDQRLALEWVRDNIAAFGGDPEKITIFGQSSGGLSVGLQILAYGASKEIPFQRAICESQALEGGITGNFTRIAMTRLLDASTCNNTDLNSADTVTCLRNLSTQELLDVQTETYGSRPADNLGDLWLPVVDGDFLPDAPSRLVADGRFANITTIMGWTDGDIDIIISPTIATANDSEVALRGYLPGFNETSFATMQSLYPLSEFSPNPAANLTADFYRTSRIIRDIIMVCMPLYYGRALTDRGNRVYHYDQNQTFSNPLLTTFGLPDLGVIHTSEFAYVFGNLSHYDVDGFPFLPNASDYSLLTRESRSWSSFASKGKPSIRGKKTIQGWQPAYGKCMNENLGIYVIGGGQDGFFKVTGGENEVLNGQKLEERCAFFNSPEIIEQLNY